MAENIDGIDFGYHWLWVYGSLLLCALLFVGANVGFYLNVDSDIPILLSVFSAWSFCGFLLNRFLFRFNERLKMPTEDFLISGKGRVLDMGCGSGRTTIMVAENRPETNVVALDNFSAPYINDHNESHLVKNLKAAVVGQFEISPS